MYGIVLAAALTTGTGAADFGFHKRCHSCYTCWSACSCSCSCSGCYGCYTSCGCYGCASYKGCWTSCGCYGCYGYCGSWGGCCSCSSCYSACSCVSYGCASYGCASYGCASNVIIGCAAPIGCAIPTEGAVIIDGQVSVGQAATVVVKADPSVVIKVNGQTTPRRGVEDSYQSPALAAGRTYSYTVVAEYTKDGKAMTESKEITVAAGRRTEVDFTKLGGSVAKVEAEPASVTVVLPDGAKLTVNDVAVTASNTQTFQTPKLEKGKSYFYTVKAEMVKGGKAVTETRKIDVAAGKAVTVDFTAPAVLTASR